MPVVFYDKTHNSLARISKRWRETVGLITKQKLTIFPLWHKYFSVPTKQENCVKLQAEPGIKLHLLDGFFLTKRPLIGVKKRR